MRAEGPADRRQVAPPPIAADIAPDAATAIPASCRRRTPRSADGLARCARHRRARRAALRRRRRRRRSGAPFRHAALRLFECGDGAALASYQRVLAARDHLLCYAVKANSNLAILQWFARARLRLRHRLGRRARARPRRRRRPGTDRLLGRRQDARRDGPRARARRPLLQRRERRRARAADRRGARRRPACARQPARQPRRRSEDAPVHLDRPA